MLDPLRQLIFHLNGFLPCRCKGCNHISTLPSAQKSPGMLQKSRSLPSPSFPFSSSGAFLLPLPFPANLVAGGQGHRGRVISKPPTLKPPSKKPPRSHWIKREWGEGGVQALAAPINKKRLFNGPAGRAQSEASWVQSPLLPSPCASLYHSLLPSPAYTSPQNNIHFQLAEHILTMFSLTALAIFLFAKKQGCH